MKKLSIFSSSNASDLPSIIDKINFGFLKGKCEISLGIINKEGIGAIDKFNNNKIPYLFFNTKNKEIAYEEIHNELIEYGIDFIICIGWMNIMPFSFVKKWNKKILNIHPSILPNFPGAHSIQDALKAGVLKTGCTVHFIDEGIDTGEIIMQKEIEIMPFDTFESLKLKIQKAEQEIYPISILKVIDNDSI